MDLKKDIRKTVIERRNRISEKDWEEKSRIIFEKVSTHPFFLESDTVYCYLDYCKEAGTKSMIEKAWALGKKVAVPKVLGENMDFYYIHSFDELKAGYKGILEPDTEEIADGSKGIMIMPGVAFDKNRNRIGYGKGFYDRYLILHPQLSTLAIAMELQLVTEIPADEHDIRPEVLITEEHIYV